MTHYLLSSGLLMMWQSSRSATIELHEIAFLVTEEVLPSGVFQ